VRGLFACDVVATPRGIEWPRNRDESIARFK
jgi:hypothetical protein